MKIEVITDSVKIGLDLGAYLLVDRCVNAIIKEA